MTWRQEQRREGCFAALRKIATEEGVVPRAFEHVREVCQHAAQFRVRLQNGGEQDAVAASDIHEAAPLPEVIGTGDGWAHQRGKVRHSVIKDTCDVRMLRRYSQPSIPKSLDLADWYGCCTGSLQTGGSRSPSPRK